MNRIWNSNYNDNFNVRRTPSKYNFKIGEMVYGRVVKSIDVNEAIIKLINGLEFHAEVDGGVNELDKDLVKFIVESFSDNKVQLKIFKSPEEKGKAINDEILKFISAEGLSEDDAKILESMLKFDMTLSKEKIRDIKSLFEFKERISANPNEINRFIDKYLESKEIKQNSVEGQNIKEKLSQFFKAFSTLEMDDILLFLENDIDFSKETIDSYRRMFRGDSNIDNTLQNKIDNFNDGDTDISKGNKNINDVINTIKSKVEKLDVMIPKVIQSDNFLEQDNGIVDVNDEFNLNNKDVILKQNTNKDLIKEVFNQIFKGKNIEVSQKELDIVINIVKNNESKFIDKSNIERLLSNLVGKEVILSEKEYKDLFEIVKGKENKLQSSDLESFKLPKEIIKEAISTRAEEGKQIIKNVLDLLSDGLDSSELLSTIKNNLSDIKLFNKLSDQYYYVDVPLNFNEKEYPCKIIIKDKRKEGKTIDSKNVKLVLTLKTSNFGTIDSYVQVLNNNINIKLSCNEKYMNIFEISKSKLENIIKSLGFTVKVDVEKKQEEVSLTTCREFFGDNNVAGIDIKV
jgi:hypothetical protein